MPEQIRVVAGAASNRQRAEGVDQVKLAAWSVAAALLVAEAAVLSVDINSETARDVRDTCTVVIVACYLLFVAAWKLTDRPWTRVIPSGTLPVMLAAVLFQINPSGMRTASSSLAGLDQYVTPLLVTAMLSALFVWPEGRSVQRGMWAGAAAVACWQTALTISGEPLLGTHHSIVRWAGLPLVLMPASAALVLWRRNGRSTHPVYALAFNTLVLRSLGAVTAVASANMPAASGLWRAGMVAFAVAAIVPVVAIAINLNGVRPVEQPDSRHERRHRSRSAVAAVIDDPIGLVGVRASPLICAQAAALSPGVRMIVDLPVTPTLHGRSEWDMQARAMDDDVYVRLQAALLEAQLAYADQNVPAWVGVKADALGAPRVQQLLLARAQQGVVVELIGLPSTLKSDEVQEALAALGDRGVRFCAPANAALRHVHYSRLPYDLTCRDDEEALWIVDQMIRQARDAGTAPFATARDPQQMEELRRIGVQVIQLPRPAG